MYITDSIIVNRRTRFIIVATESVGPFFFLDGAQLTDHSGELEIERWRSATLEISEDKRSRNNRPLDTLIFIYIYKSVVGNQTDTIMNCVAERKCSRAVSFSSFLCK